MSLDSESLPSSRLLVCLMELCSQVRFVVSLEDLGTD